MFRLLREQIKLFVVTIMETCSQLTFMGTSFAKGQKCIYLFLHINNHIFKKKKSYILSIHTLSKLTLMWSSGKKTHNINIFIHINIFIKYIYKYYNFLVPKTQNINICFCCTNVVNF